MKILKIHSLEKGWQETDEMILHSVMQLLVDYVEKQKPGEVVDWSWQDDRTEAWEAIQDTYDWWVNRRPARVDPLDGIDTPDDYFTFDEPDEHGNRLVIWGDYPEIHEAYLNATKIEQKWYEEDTNMIQRVVGIRGYLWT